MKRRNGLAPKTAIAGLALAVASTLLTLALLEGGARAYENYLQPVESRELWAFRRGRPAPYEKSAYYSSDFVREMRKAPGGWFTPPSSTLVIPNDFSGRWIVTRDGRRQTLGHPARPRHTIWLVGGSTVFNIEVPDAYTIASQLQNKINQSQGNLWRVENIGASTVQSAQELERLKTLPVRPGDMVVFYDGVNDVTQGIFANNPGGWMVKSNREALTPYMRVMIALRDRSAFFRLLANPFATQPPAHLADEAKLNGLINRTIGLYGQSVKDAAHFTRARGARFVHVLQPMLFSQPQLTGYEQKIAANPSLVAPGLEAALRATYPHLKKALPQLAGHMGWDYADFTGVLNGDTEYYLDYCHVTERGNAVVAGYLHEVLFGKMAATQQH